MKSMSIILFLIISCASAYRTNMFIMTKTKSKQNIRDALMSHEFYAEYLKKIGAENIISDPPLIDYNTNTLEFPQRFSYNYNPITPFTSNKNTNIHVTHVWSEYDGKFYGVINTKFMNCDITLSPVTSEFDNEMNGLAIEGCIIHKKYYIIPNKILDYILKEFCDIFLNFIAKK